MLMSNVQSSFRVSQARLRRPRLSRHRSGISHLVKRGRGLGRGFTLVEVLAAMVFIGIVIPVAMRCVAVCTQSTLHARHLLEASELAQQKIAEILVQRDTSLLNAAGDFNPDFPDYSWQVESAAFDPADMGLSDVYQVTVHVRWFERSIERSYKLSTLVYPDSSSSSSSTTAGANQ